MQTKSGDRKQIVGCPGPGLAGRMQARDYRGALENVGGWACSLSWLWWWFHGCLHMSKLVKLLTLNTCSFLSVNYASLKVFTIRRVVARLGVMIGKDVQGASGIQRSSVPGLACTLHRSCLHYNSLSWIWRFLFYLLFSVIGIFHIFNCFIEMQFTYYQFARLKCTF